MKKLIIILALVGVTFLALLVYGANRNEQPEPRPECKPMPKLKSNEEPDADQLEGWCPPSLAMASKKLQARFGPTLGLDPPRSISNSANAEGIFDVDPSPKRNPAKPDPQDVRSARITLTGGNYAILTGGDDNKLCLCRAGAAPSGKMFEGDVCGGQWTREHNPNQQCTRDDESGVLPFGENGGKITLKTGDKATVSIE